jgi:peptidyl-prolyl cis-trans isomerase B (cyclophilin B)
VTIPPPPPYGEYPLPYGEYPPGYPPPQQPTTNGFAIASLICAFLFFPLGIVFGHVSLSQIKKTREGGHGLAVAGLVVSYVVAALTAVAVVATVVLAGLLVRVADDLNAQRSRSGAPTGAPATGQPLPAFKPSATLGSNCQYPATTAPAGKPVQPPRTGRIPTTPASVTATIATNDGAIGLELDNG